MEGLEGLAGLEGLTDRGREPTRDQICFLSSLFFFSIRELERGRTSRQENPIRLVRCGCGLGLANPFRIDVTGPVRYFDT